MMCHGIKRLLLCYCYQTWYFFINPACLRACGFGHFCKLPLSFVSFLFLFLFVIFFFWQKHIFCVWSFELLQLFHLMLSVCWDLEVACKGQDLLMIDKVEKNNKHLFALTTHLYPSPQTFSSKAEKRFWSLKLGVRVDLWDMYGIDGV